MIYYQSEIMRTTAPEKKGKVSQILPLIQLFTVTTVCENYLYDSKSQGVAAKKKVFNIIDCIHLHPMPHASIFLQAASSGEWDWEGDKQRVCAALADALDTPSIYTLWRFYRVVIIKACDFKSYYLLYLKLAWVLQNLSLVCFQKCWNLMWIDLLFFYTAFVELKSQACAIKCLHIPNQQKNKHNYLGSLFFGLAAKLLENSVNVSALACLLFQLLC